MKNISTIIMLLICVGSRSIGLTSAQAAASFDKYNINGTQITGVVNDSISTNWISSVLLTANAVKLKLSGINTGNVPEVTNLYYTDARARAASSGGTGISYIGGVITNTATYTAPTLTAATRPINSTTWTISSTKQSSATYYISITCTATIGSNSSGQVELQYSTNGGSTWIPVGVAKSSNTVTLAIVLNSTTIQITPISVVGLPINALCRMVPTTSGTTTVSYVYGFETY